MDKILLDDLLHIPAEETESLKVRFNQHNGAEDPMELYLRDPEIVNTRWLLWRSKQRPFSVGQVVIGLLKLSPETWLLTTVKRIKKGPSGITLIPNNPVFDPLFYTNDEIQSLPVRILGTVVELRAKF